MFNVKYSLLFQGYTCPFLTLFRMGLFGAAHGWVGGKKLPPPSQTSVTRIWNDEVWHRYALPKSDPKI